MQKIESPIEFYRALACLIERAPESVRDSLCGDFRNCMYELADRIAKLLDPKKLDDIRSWSDFDLIDAGLSHLLMRARDEGGTLDLADAVGLNAVLQSNANSPDELADFVRARHREMFDGLPCSKCGGSVPYEDLCISTREDGDGRANYHEECLPKRR